MHPLFVIVGMPGSGKSTVVAFLSKMGWPVIYFGQITLDEIKRRGMLPTQDNEKIVRESLRKEKGSAVYAEMSLCSIQKLIKNGPVVIDGLYSWDEYRLIKNIVNNPIHTIAVCSDRKIRYQRLAKRPARPLTFVESERRDFAEIESIQKGGPIAIADYTLINNDTEQDLEIALNALVSSILTQ